MVKAGSAGGLGLQKRSCSSEGERGAMMVIVKIRGEVRRRVGSRNRKDQRKTDISRGWRGRIGQKGGWV